MKLYSCLLGYICPALGSGKNHPGYLGTQWATKGVNQVFNNALPCSRY